MSNNNVLTTVTKQMISECKTIAENLYMNRTEGFSEIFDARPDASGNLPRKFYRGAVVEFTAGSVDALLDLVITKMSQGWKRSAAPTTNIGTTFFLTYLVKPDSEIQSDLIEELKDAEAVLRERIEKENEAIIAKTVAQRKVQVLRQREEAAKAADEALEAELEAEVRAALKGAK